jgi:hypothetical protein
VRGHPRLPSSRITARQAISRIGRLATQNDDEPLWLGHADVRSTQPYLHADLTIKEKALALVTPADVEPGRYKPADTTLAFLESL